MPPPVPPFSPPTPDQVRDHLRNHLPRHPSKLTAWMPLMALGLVLLLAVGSNSLASVLLPWVVVIGLFAWLSIRTARLRSLERQVRQAQELGMVRRYRESLELSWRLVPKLTTIPELHGRAVAFVGLGLDQAKAYEAAIVAYDFLLERMPGEHPAAVMLRINRAIAQLAADHLTDADDQLRRLRGVIEQMPDSPASAAYRLAVLIQQVKTNHAADAVAESDRLLDELRPLGIEAGYGHALIALCCHQLAEQSPQAGAMRELASEWWARATLLLSPAVLVDRFADLRVMTQAAPVPPAPVDAPLSETAPDGSTGGVA